MNNVEHKDTYFINHNKALETAKQSNRVKTSNPNVDALQICYYSENEIKNAPENCIYVPLEDIYNYFITTTKRFPKEISFEGSNYEKNEENDLRDAINNVLKVCSNERKSLGDVYLEEIKKLKPDFNEDKYRVFVPACRETTVMKNISKYIAQSLENYNVEVFFYIQSELEDCNVLSLIVNQYNFNPHIIISINHLNNSFLHEDVFNFVWFQDPMLALEDSKNLEIRKRDFIFSLTSMIDNLLEKKNISYERQNFLINKDLIQDKLEKENKIVFIGSSYVQQLDNDALHNNILNELKSRFDLGLSFDDTYIRFLEKKFKIAFEKLKNKIVPFVIRDYSVLQLCTLDTELDIEIYGWGWEGYPELSKFYKGALNHGDQLFEVLKSAKYSLCPHSDYIIQQRVLESAICGCQPIIYDCKYNDIGPFYEDTLMFYKNKEDILKCINNEKINYDKLLDFIHENDYDKFSKKILDIVNKETTTYE